MWKQTFYCNVDGRLVTVEVVIGTRRAWERRVRAEPEEYGLNSTVMCLGCRFHRLTTAFRMRRHPAAVEPTCRRGVPTASWN